VAHDGHDISGWGTDGGQVDRATCRGVGGGMMAGSSSLLDQNTGGGLGGGSSDYIKSSSASARGGSKMFLNNISNNKYVEPGGSSGPSQGTGCPGDGSRGGGRVAMTRRRASWKAGHGKSLLAHPVTSDDGYLDLDGGDASMSRGREVGGEPRCDKKRKGSVDDKLSRSDLGLRCEV
jgi:hypothetical protein